MTAQEMNKRALTAAMKYIGEFAWPTILIALIACVGFVVTPVLVFLELLGLGWGTMLMALFAYLSYTIMHDSVHGAIAGKHVSWRWINSFFGYFTGLVLGIAFTAHRHEHIAHHRHTNDPKHDPDFQISQMTQSPWMAILCSWRLVVGNYSFYRQHRWAKAPQAEKIKICTEVVVAIGARVVLMSFDFWLEGLFLFAVGPAIGVTFVIYLFAYIVHRPHQEAGRYVDTSTIDAEGFSGWVMTWAWMFQNYHSIHHLFPKVPFYRYRAVFKEIESIMRCQGAPIYQLTWSGLKPQKNIETPLEQAL